MLSLLRQPRATVVGATGLVVGLIMVTTLIVADRPRPPGGPGDRAMGTAGRDAAAVVDTAVSALRSTVGVRITGTAVDSRRAVRFDYRFTQDSCAVTATWNAGSWEIRRVDGRTYLRLDPRAVAMFQANQNQAPRILGNRWLEVTHLASLLPERGDVVTLDGFADTLDLTPLRGGTVTRATAGGEPVTQVTGDDGSILLVDTLGRPRDLELRDRTQGRYAFRDFGVAPMLEPPTDVLDPSSFLPPDR